MEIDVERLGIATKELQTTLKDGLIAMDIWDRATGLTLIGHNSQPTAVALLTEIIHTLNDMLTTFGYARLNRYFFAELKDHRAMMIIPHGKDLLQSIVVDTRKTNLGVLLAIALPKMQSRITIPGKSDAVWKRVLTGPEPKLSSLATRLLVARLRDTVQTNPGALEPSVNQLYEFFMANTFAIRDLATL